jgi:hypothetical protein
MKCIRLVFNAIRAAQDMVKPLFINNIREILALFFAGS